MIEEAEHYWPKWKVDLSIRFAYTPNYYLRHEPIRLREIAGKAAAVDCLNYLFELAQDRSLGIDFTLDRAYLVEEKRRKKSLAFIGREYPKDRRFGLGALYPKVTKRQVIVADELPILLKGLPEELSEYLIVTIKEVDQQKITERFDSYLDAFINDKLVSGGSRPYKYEKHRDLFCELYWQKWGKFGQRQTVTLVELCDRAQSRPFVKFWELAFALQREGYIKILNFRYTLTGDDQLIEFEALDALERYRPAPDSDWGRRLEREIRLGLRRPDDISHGAGLQVTPDGGFRFNGEYLRGISTETLPGKLLALYINKPKQLVTDSEINERIGTEDTREIGFISRNLKEQLRKNRLIINTERRRNRGYIFHGVVTMTSTESAEIQSKNDHS